MAPSSEYPDLKWIPPRAWGRGRDGKAVRYIVIHYTAGSETATSAENGAIYNQNRRDGTSAHYFVDRDSVVQGVLTRDRANCARRKGNRLGIQYELCGTVQTRAQWLDAASLPTLRLAAKQAARDCRKYDIPVRRLTVAETRRAWTEYPNGPKGFVGHVDCTYAYPEDGGDHTDPGGQFPWDIFLDMVRAELAPPAPKEWDEMATKAEIRAEFDAAIFAYFSGGYDAALGKAPKDTPEDRRKRHTRLHLRGILGGPVGDVDEREIAEAVLAGLGGGGQSDEEIAAALRAALGDRAGAVGQLLAA